jgi:hypothetical protein
LEVYTAMPVPSISGYARLTKAHKFSAVGIVAASAAAMAFAVVPGHSQAHSGVQDLAAQPAGRPSAWSTSLLSSKIQQAGVEKQSETAAAQARSEAATQSAAAQKTAARKAEAQKTAALKTAALKTAAQKKAVTEMAAMKRAAAATAAKQKDAKAHAAKQAASRSANRQPVVQVKAATTYGNNLDGWIRQSLDIMKAKGIPGSYSGIQRNIMRESSGNARAINNWDINARNGVPSKGLLQVIEPTFRTYHVSGTSWDIYDPVANITAACNYAAARYGSMDHVNSAY